MAGRAAVGLRVRGVRPGADPQAAGAAAGCARGSSPRPTWSGGRGRRRWRWWRWRSARSRCASGCGSCRWWRCTAAAAIPMRCAPISSSTGCLPTSWGLLRRRRCSGLTSGSCSTTRRLPSRRQPRQARSRNPYKGLRPFAEEDAGDFFGRERLVAELLASLEAGAAAWWRWSGLRDAESPAC